MKTPLPSLQMLYTSFVGAVFSCFPLAAGVFSSSAGRRVCESRSSESLSLFIESCAFDSSQAGVGIEIQLKLSWKMVFRKVRPKTCVRSGLAAPSLSQEQPRQGFGAKWGAKGAPDSDIFRYLQEQNRDFLGKWLLNFRCLESCWARF